VKLRYKGGSETIASRPESSRKATSVLTWFILTGAAGSGDVSHDIALKKLFYSLFFLFLLFFMKYSSELLSPTICEARAQ